MLDLPPLLLYRCSLLGVKLPEALNILHHLFGTLLLLCRLPFLQQKLAFRHPLQPVNARNEATGHRPTRQGTQPRSEASEKQVVSIQATISVGLAALFLFFVLLNDMRLNDRQLARHATHCKFIDATGSHRVR